MPDKTHSSLISMARADGAQEPIVPLKLGERVRALRKQRNMTLEQAAKRAGLARSTLSKIENEQMSPTFDAVRKLAHGLGISVPQLFTPPRAGAAGGRMAVTRAGEGRAHLTTTYEHELLAANMKGKQMLPYRARVRARDLEEFTGWVRHDGEEFLYVLSGIVRFYSEFYEPLEMRRGDSVYYDATMGHNVISISQEDAVILWVTSMA